MVSGDVGVPSHQNRPTAAEIATSPRTLHAASIAEVTGAKDAAVVAPAVLLFILLLLIAWVFIARLTEIRDLLSDALRRLLARRGHENRPTYQHYPANHDDAGRACFASWVYEAQGIAVRVEVRVQTTAKTNRIALREAACDARVRTHPVPELAGLLVRVLPAAVTQRELVYAKPGGIFIGRCIAKWLAMIEAPYRLASRVRDQAWRVEMIDVS